MPSTVDPAQAIADLVHREAGLAFDADRFYLIRARLSRRLQAIGCDLTAYAQRCRCDPDERGLLLDLLTTNHTAWWRDGEHFADLIATVLPALKSRRLRVWCAAAASGEEPYSVALALVKALPDRAAWDIAILATDISTRALAKLRAGEYASAGLAVLSAEDRALAVEPAPGRPGQVRVRPALRDLVHIARLNLMAEWPMRECFDVIFCRNVMIYFDPPTQERLVHRLVARLVPGGTLYIGMGEGLAGFPHPLRQHGPAIFRH